MKNNANGAAALFTPLAPPILRSVDPQRVSNFLLERERYELQIAARQGELPDDFLVPILASIDRSLLRNLLRMGDFDGIAHPMLPSKL